MGREKEGECTNEYVNDRRAYEGKARLETSSNMKKKLQTMASDSAEVFLSSSQTSINSLMFGCWPSSTSASGFVGNEEC